MRRPTSNIWKQTFDLFYTSDVWHLLLYICNLSSDVWYIVSGIRHILEIRRLTSADSRHHTYITHQTSDIWPLDIFYTPDIWHLLLNICNVSSDIWYIISGTIYISEVRCLTSAYIRRLTSDTRYISDIRRLVTSAYIRHLTADIGHHTYFTHQTSDIWLLDTRRLTSVSRHLSSDV